MIIVATVSGPIAMKIVAYDRVPDPGPKLMATCQLRALAETDATRVRAWLADWLFEHISGWVPAYGLAWGPEEIRAHIAHHELVEREWVDIVRASTAAHSLVLVADEHGEGVGIVYGELTEDRYIGVPVGVVSWIYVDPAKRGVGVAANLLAAARAWHIEHGASVSEVFVTISNTAAVRTYASAGFVPIDYRRVAKFSAIAEQEGMESATR